MDKAELILYGVATYLAIKSLVSLMSDHRETYKKKLAEELKAAVAAAPPAVAAPTATKSGAPANPKTAAAASQQNAKVNTAKPAVKKPAGEVAKTEAAAKKAG